MSEEPDQILAQVRRLAEMNGGQPVGERIFSASLKVFDDREGRGRRY